MAFFYAREGRWKEKPRVIEELLAEALVWEMRRSADQGWRAWADWPSTQRAVHPSLPRPLARGLVVPASVLRR